MEKSSLRVISQNGLLLTSDITDPFIRALATLGDGAVMEKAAGNMQEAFKRIIDGDAEKATITISVEVKKNSKDNQMFELTARTKLSTPTPNYTGITFVNKDYMPDRNRNENTLFHS